MHQRPHGARQATACPGLDQLLGKYVRAQHIARRQVGGALQVLNAQTQVVEFGARRIQHRRADARGDDLALNDFVVDQAQGCGGIKCQFAGPAHGDQRFTPPLTYRSYPSLPLTLKPCTGFHRQLHFRQRCAAWAALGQLKQVRLNAPHQLDNQAVQRINELLSHLTRDAVFRCRGRGRRDHERAGAAQYRMTSGSAQRVFPLRQTTAPAFGSFGSPSLRPPPLTRSSRRIPSHMAIAAATNTDE